MNIRTNINTALLLFLTAILSFSIIPAKAQVTTGTLIEEMANLKRLAEYPSPFYNTIQFSSYDHRSTLPDAPDWFENSDGFGREPIPGFEKVLKEPGQDGIGQYLICDVKGPGAIVRLWTAAINGTIQLFLDGTKSQFTTVMHSIFLSTPTKLYPKKMILT